MTTRHELAAGVVTDLLFEEPGVGRCLVAPDGSVLRANAEWLRSTGFTLDDVLGADIIALFPETRDMALAMHARVRAGHRVEVPRHEQTVNGRETRWEGSIAPVPMDGGTGLLITTREVPAAQLGPSESGVQPALNRSRPSRSRLRRHASEAIIERRLRELADHAPAAVFVKDAAGRYVYANRWLLELLGLQRHEAIGRTVDDLFPPRVAKRTRDRERRLSSGTEIVTEDTVPTPNGRRVLLTVRFPFALASGEVGTCGIAVDITARKSAEEAQRRSDLLIQALANNVRDQLVVLRAKRSSIGGDLEWEYVDANDSAIELLGTTRERLIGNTLRDVVGERAARTEPLLLKVLTTGERERYETKYRDRTLLVTLFRVDPETVASASIDLTEQRRAEDARREALERYERQARLFEGVTSTTPDFVYLFDLQGRFLYANDRLLEVWGMQLSDAVGKTCRELGYEQWHHDMHMREIAQVIETKRPIKGEVPFKAPLTGIFGVYEYIFTPVLGPDGAVEIIAGTTRDVTDRKQAEEALRDANEKLREADRRKDEFLGMLSHELRNPLAPIRNSTYILRNTPPGSEQAIRAQGVIERQTEHLTRLVDDLLDVTRIARGKVELRRSRIDLREVVSRAAEDFRVLMHDRAVAFDVLIPDARLWADADATRITQIIGNLLHNAAKFTRQGDQVALSVAAVNGHAEVRVRDTGAGIDPALLPYVFDPFVQGERTLARTEGGLGLGLALVKGIAELHGGSVSAYSAGKGRGAEFVVALPLLAGGPAGQQPLMGPVRAKTRRRVLVVDDNPDSAESLGEIAALLGHDVEIALDGPTAVEKARVHPPDVVLCDIGLPGMSGYEVARTLRAKGDNRVRLYAISGYAQPEDVKQSLDAGFDGHIAKPADPSELERLLGA